MRVHGDKEIRRRNAIEPKSNYHDYLAELQEDFAHICGYCGKSEEVTKNAFEIDHFVPLKYAPERENDYEDLVYACFVCNRKKSSKWPSKDKNIQFLNGEGFIDPASEEYNNHLERDEEGNIVGITEAGKYMVTKGLHFNQRPMKEIWKAMQLFEKKKALQKKMQYLSGEDLQRYIVIDKLISGIQKYLFAEKE